MINIQSMAERKRKRDVLTSEEQRQLRKYVNAFPTIVDAAFAIGIHRNVLDRVLFKGSGSPETIEAIKGKIVQAQA
jgi:hypothetical protein